MHNQVDLLRSALEVFGLVSPQYMLTTRCLPLAQAFCYGGHCGTVRTEVRLHEKEWTLRLRYVCIAFLIVVRGWTLCRVMTSWSSGAENRGLSVLPTSEQRELGILVGFYINCFVHRATFTWTRSLAWPPEKAKFTVRSLKCLLLSQVSMNSFQWIKLSAFDL